MNTTAVFDMIIVVLGAYLIYHAWKMKKTGEISTIIVHREEIKLCKDKQGFISRIYRQTQIFGSVALAFGVIGCISDAIRPLGSVFDMGSVIIFLAVWFWFTREVRREKKQFFY